jgi:hypothetical protein
LGKLGASSPKERDIVATYVAMEALNAWALFSRSFYLSCALGTRTELNERVVVATVTDHIGFAIKHFKKSAKPNSSGTWHRRDEPTWHDPNVLMTVCKSLGCSIQSELEAAFSLRQTVFKNLPVLRNFFAHRNEETSRAARNIGPQYTLPTSLPPAELLLAVSPGGYASLILTWLDEMRITAEIICRG